MANNSKPPLISSLLLFLALLLGIYAAPLIEQEGNPLPFVRAILSLELTSSTITPVTDLQLLQKAGANDPINDYLAAYGWQQREQLGSAIVYQQEERQLMVSSRMYTGRYIIYELEHSLP